MALAEESEASLRRPSLLLPSIHAHNQLVGFLDFILTKLAILDPLELGSVDGLPPIPVTLSWARDGILIVGMQSEMRVFNQVNYS